MRWLNELIAHERDTDETTDSTITDSTTTSDTRASTGSTNIREQ